jgi:predicted small secreted protein
MSSVPAKRRILTVALLLGLVGMVQACNTVEGAGKDVKKAGQGIENSADRNK